MVWVAARWQLANAKVDDDQRHSTLLLHSLLERLLEELEIRVRNTWRNILVLIALPLIDFPLHILPCFWVKFLLERNFESYLNLNLVDWKFPPRGEKSWSCRLLLSPSHSSIVEVGLADRASGKCERSSKKNLIAGRNKDSSWDRVKQEMVLTHCWLGTGHWAGSHSLPDWCHPKFSSRDSW